MPRNSYSATCPVCHNEYDYSSAKEAKRASSIWARRIRKEAGSDSAAPVAPAEAQADLLTPAEARAARIAVSIFLASPMTEDFRDISDSDLIGVLRKLSLIK